MAPVSPANSFVTIARRADNVVHGVGSSPPQTFNNKGFFALFALLGAAMVIAAIWFFFWAKNGGFQFQEGDWDDYKSTVLRRKGPDGKTLSNATKSTKLGGGRSIAGTQQFQWAKQQARSVVSRDEKGRKGILAKRGWGNSHSVTYSDDFTDSLASQTVTDGMTEVMTEYDGGSGHHNKRYRDRDVKQYKKEKPARVGGMNRVADSTAYTETDRSDIMTETVLTESSDQPMLPKTQEQKDKARAERRARHEAAKMERRWKREAEEAAAALNREAAPPPPPAHVRKSASPSKHASSRHHRERSASRSASPRKRDFSYGTGPESETLSTAYTASESNSRGTRTASYYDEYRPRASDNPRYSTEHGTRTERSRTRQSSPRKKESRKGGYRRGGQDSDLE
ncbi:hypothetical protein Slin15195_G054820 [Septoria linicola]|uniref:Endosomal spry domain-containing protein n=1 Tax=Septoria linicola TaxID=215465 RepID=A0A9Q9AS32_9PEZI|nr:hypothetical protein Slin14017_G070680 [Septoria linicola]USW52163.1 hypothetical protein Slin15195_G054820 [Septoria linicola]